MQRWIMLDHFRYVIGSFPFTCLIVASIGYRAEVRKLNVESTIYKSFRTRAMPCEAGAYESMLHNVSAQPDMFLRIGVVARPSEIKSRSPGHLQPPTSRLASSPDGQDVSGSDGQDAASFASSREGRGGHRGGPRHRAHAIGMPPWNNSV